MKFDDVSTWANQLFEAYDPGDSRRKRRLIQYTVNQARDPGASVNSVCKGNPTLRQATYRFLSNPRLQTQEIARAGFAFTAKQVAHYDVLLAIQDTTTLSYSHSVASELGDLGGPKDSYSRGWQVHSTLLVDPQTRFPLGLLNQKRWLRETESRGQRHKRAERPYEEKESYKWEESEREAEELLGESRNKIITVCDCEADVYEFLAYKLSRSERFIVRARHNRQIPGEIGNLWEKLANQTALGEQIIEVGQKGGRKRREAVLTVRSATVRLRRPWTAESDLKQLSVNAVYALEENPPEGAEPLEWLILTSEKVEEFDDALWVLECYRLRWFVEDFHKAWKSGGCEVENRRLESPENLERQAVILAFIAVRLLQLRELAESNKKASCEEVFEGERWKCLWLSVEKKKLPKRTPKIKWAHEALAKLGGWYKSQRDQWRPGYQILWRGWLKLESLLEGWRLAQQHNS